VSTSGKNAWIWVVVAAVVLVSPWPLLALARRPLAERHIVAIPVDESGRVSRVFGRAPHFVIVNLRTGDNHVIENPYQAVAHGAGLKCSRLLMDEHVGVAIAQEIGPEPYNNLTARGIAVYVGRPATVPDALSQLQRGVLALARGPTVHTHHGRELVGLPPVPSPPACPLPGPVPRGAPVAPPAAK